MTLQAILVKVEWESQAAGEFLPGMEFGISYIDLFQDAMKSLAPVVQRLAGR